MALLEGQWTSRGKPASLLPSDVTLCRDEDSELNCWSVPRNVDTRYGEAVYKVEATLHDFSADGNFRIAYRTLVRLLGAAGGDKTTGDAADDNWQVSEYSMRCQLSFPTQVSCRDDKGTVRDYSR